MAAQLQRAPELRPGRICPISYRYPPRVFNRAPEIVAETLYVVGGLYGNVEALDAVIAMAQREAAPATIVFNGDFHWFDIAADDFRAIAQGVASHARLRGNVETELASDESAAGCGCAYPLDVSDAEVSRSNEILERLRATAGASAAERLALGALPMHLVARVGDARVGIVHGDAASLAGWGFAHDRLDDPGHGRWVEAAFRDAQVDVFASTHTCLPTFRHFVHGHGEGIVANNGAAGMPNFAGTEYGLVTRIARTPSRQRLFGIEHAGVQVEAVPLRFDRERWMQRFLAAWPQGSPAHASYFRRIASGPRFAPAQAAPRRIVVH
jgi:hypothetical protein